MHIDILKFGELHQDGNIMFTQNKLMFTQFLVTKD